MYVYVYVYVPRRALSWHRLLPPPFFFTGRSKMLEMSLVGIASLLSYKLSQKFAAPATKPAPSGKTQYWSTYTKELAAQEQALADSRANQARTPLTTNVVPTFFDLSMTNAQQTGILDGPMFNKSVNRMLSTAPAQSSRLAEVPANFTHSNMSPFYSGYGQGTGSNDTMVERFTGGTIVPGKREVPSFSLPQVQNVYGALPLSMTTDPSRMQQMESNRFNHQYPTPIQFPDAPDRFSLMNGPTDRNLNETRAGENQRAVTFAGRTNAGAATYGALGPVWTATTPNRGAEDRKPKSRVVPSMEMFRNVTTVGKAEQAPGERTSHKTLDVSDIVFDHVPHSAIGGRAGDPGLTTRFRKNIEQRDPGLTYDRQTIPTVDARKRPEPFARTKKEEGMIFGAMSNPSRTNRNQADRTLQPEDTHRASDYDLFVNRPLFGQLPQQDHVLPGTFNARQTVEHLPGNHFSAPTMRGGATPSMSMFATAAPNAAAFENERVVDRQTVDTGARFLPLPANEFVIPRRL